MTVSPSVHVGSILYTNWYLTRKDIAEVDQILTSE